MGFHCSASDVQLASDIGVIAALQKQFDNSRSCGLENGLWMLKRVTWRKGRQRFPLCRNRLIVVRFCQPIECSSANTQETRS